MRPWPDTKISAVSVTDLREVLELIADLQNTLQELTAEIAASRSTRKTKAYAKAVALLERFKADTK
jgi:hypothetical protein